MADSTSGGNEQTFEFPQWYKPRERFRFGIRSLLLLTVVVVLLLGCVLNLPAILGWAYGHWQVGRQYDQCTFEGSQFSLRITAFHERGAVFGALGSYHRYEVKAPSDWTWREILMYRRPTPTPIARNQFVRLPESRAYFFLDDLFAVTSDGGTTWSFRGGAWSGFNYMKFSARQVDPSAAIESLTINEDGSGVVCLSNYDYTAMKRLPSQDFETTDYGLTWREMQPGAP